MKAFVIADPELPLFLGENEIGRIPFGESIDVLNWDIDETWAYVQYKSIAGYAAKKSLKLETDLSTTPEQSTFDDYLTFSGASGRDLPYIVYQVTLKEKFFGTGSRNLEDLENVINHFYSKGYKLHTMSTATSDGSKGFGGGDRIQATLVFEKVGLFS